jgi:signal transduction histidine kinase
LQPSVFFGYIAHAGAVRNLGPINASGVTQRLNAEDCEMTLVEDRKTTRTTAEMRKTGLDVVHEMPWGTHICLFYETKKDLLHTLVPYCKAGLESEEFCLWVVAEPLTVKDATDSLSEAIPDFDRYLADSSIEIVAARDWYLQGGTFDLERVTSGWHAKLAHASARGYAGVRVTGDTAWLLTKDWKRFVEYEEGLNSAVANQRLAVLCTYPVAACGALEILDVVRTHQFALVRRHETWDLIETAGLKKAKAEIERLVEELEERVEERTTELMRSAEALREAQAELAHVNRVTTIEHLTASIAHEIRQPITAMIANAQAGLLWLNGQPPNLEEIRETFDQVVTDGRRANEVVNRIRTLVTKAPPRRDLLDINETILDVVALVRSEMLKHRISLQTRLATSFPHLQGDRVQLQQVILNLVMNAIEAMSSVEAGPRELLISVGEAESRQVLVTVHDSGPGVDPQSMDRIFDAFYTTKLNGMGMGLAICKSIVEAHGGRMWATTNKPQGAILHFTLSRE